MEDLSQLLDEMNMGQYPKSIDEETADLLYVASLIKKADLPIEPPPHILEQTVAKVVASLPPSTTPKNRKWLYSSALGTAASILLLFGLHLMPSWSEAPSIMPPSPLTETASAIQEPPNEKQKSISSQTAPQELPEPAKTIAPPSKIEEKIPPKKAIETTPPPSSLNPDKAPPIIKEESNMIHQSKSAHKLKMLPLMEETPPSPLSLPGKVADAIVIDEKSNTVRQIFYKDTPEQIIIIQRPLTNETTIDTSQTFVRTDAAQKAETATARNKITINIYDQEVTLEGYQSEQELITIGKTLTP